MDPVTDTTTAAHAATDATAAADAATDATADAAAAALAAGVRMRELTDLADLTAVCRLFQHVWRTDPTSPLVTTELLRALTKAGNYLAGAFDGDRLVGACVGFFGAPAEGVLHSHIAGVDPAAAGRSVGYALKLHQRAWTLRRGIGAIAWTFDPLVARNAYFNVVKLGATAAEYLPNFYGGMRDGVNSGDDTDRLLVHWDLTRKPTRPWPGPAAVALGRTPDDRPVRGESHKETVSVAVPPDIEALRAADPGRAKEWRVAVREVLGGLLADGAAIAGFDRTGGYVLTRRETR